MHSIKSTKMCSKKSIKCFFFFLLYCIVHSHAKTYHFIGNINSLYASFPINANTTLWMIIWMHFFYINLLWMVF